MDFPKVYVFFMKRRQDKEPFPAVYLNRELALKAFGRISPVIEVKITGEKPDGTDKAPTD